MANSRDVMTESLVHAICAEYDIEIIPGTVYPLPGQTRATATMRQILTKHGEGHFRLVMTTLGQTRGKTCDRPEHAVGRLRPDTGLSGLSYGTVQRYMRMAAKESSASLM